MPKQNSQGLYVLDQSPLYKMVSRRKLACLLRVSNGELRTLSKQADTLYREFSVPKKNGSGMRDVENPARQLKLVQATLARLLTRIIPPDYLFCPVKGRCYVSNAARHRGHRVVRCLDVRKYFPSTSARRVFWFYHKIMKCDRALAGTLTALSTYQGHLPTGSPLSPILAYYAHYDVWEAVAAICREHNCTLTVYIDDVTISGASVSAGVLWRIKHAIHRSGLRYHKEKAFFGGPAEVTGVILDGENLVVPNRQHKKMAELRKEHRLAQSDDDRAQINGRLVGLHGQTRQISLNMNRAAT